jgi:acetyl esterase/lipase
MKNDERQLVNGSFIRWIVLWSAAASLWADPPPPAHADHADLSVWIDANGDTRPVRTPDDWARRRARILAGFQQAAGAIPPDDGALPLDAQVHAEERLSAFTRKRISFAAAKDDRVPAWLLVPHDIKERRPAMLCLHQTTAIGKGEPAGLGGSPDLHYAKELAERGFVTLAPDYPNFGDYKVDVYARGWESATAKGIWNHRRAVDVLRGLPEADPDRIGVIGHSLGGHNAIFLAVFDPRVKVVVSSCGFNAFPKYMKGDLSGWSHAGYMPRIASEYGKDPKRMPFDFPELLGALAPRAVFVNAPQGDSNFEVSGVKDCVAAARPVYALFGAEDRLVAEHPDAGHEFPREVRERAYRYVEDNLKAGKGIR